MKTKREDNRPAWRPSPGEYQDIAARATDAAYKLLHAMHTMNNQVRPGMTDGGPLINGVIGGVLAFAMDGKITPEDLRAQILECVDTLMPQFVMAKAAGGQPAGRA